MASTTRPMPPRAISVAELVAVSRGHRRRLDGRYLVRGGRDHGGADRRRAARHLHRAVHGGAVALRHGRARGRDRALGRGRAGAVRGGRPLRVVRVVRVVSVVSVVAHVPHRGTISCSRRQQIALDGAHERPREHESDRGERDRDRQDVPVIGGLLVGDQRVRTRGNFARDVEPDRSSWASGIVAPPTTKPARRARAARPRWCRSGGSPARRGRPTASRSASLALTEALSPEASNRIGVIGRRVRAGDGDAGLRERGGPHFLGRQARVERGDHDHRTGVARRRTRPRRRP